MSYLTDDTWKAVTKASAEQLENVKYVIFGKQKQANVTNEAVVKLIAADLVCIGGMSCLATEDSVVETIKKYIQDAIDGNITVESNVVLLLITGEASYNCLNAAGPKVLSVSTPNPESPKVLFRVHALGDVPDVPFTSNVTINGPTLTPASTPESSREQYDYKTRVENLIKEISPLVPEAVKQELSDPASQCLCCAEYFYNL